MRTVRSTNRVIEYGLSYDVKLSNGKTIRIASIQETSDIDDFFDFDASPDFQKLRADALSNLRDQVYPFQKISLLAENFIEDRAIPLSPIRQRELDDVLKSSPLLTKTHGWRITIVTKIDNEQLERENRLQELDQAIVRRPEHIPRVILNIIGFPLVLVWGASGILTLLPTLIIDDLFINRDDNHHQDPFMVYALIMYGPLAGFVYAIERLRGEEFN